MLDAEIAGDLSIHLIVDNYSPHKHQKVRRWLERRPRFHLHFTPTSASWMNMVETFLPRSKPTSHPAGELRLGRRTG
jgi:transposase